MKKINQSKTSKYSGHPHNQDKSLPVCCVFDLWQGLVPVAGPLDLHKLNITSDISSDCIIN